MNKKLLFGLSLICFTCPLPPPVAAQNTFIEAYETMSVAGLEIKGQNLPEHSSFDSRTIVGRLKTHIGDPFSQAIFDEDLKTLAQEFDRIEPSIQVKNGQLYIEILVWPKPTIRTIKWEGNKVIKTRALKKELKISTHKAFNRHTFNKALSKVKELYIKKGYFESQIQYKLHTDPKTNEVDIIIEIREGRSGKIDTIDLIGFSKKEESQLFSMIQTKKHNLLLSWLIGTGSYNEEALEQDRMAVINFLQNEGFADAKVTIQIEDSKEKTDKIRVIITADKGPIYHFGKVTFDGNSLISDEKIESVFIARPDSSYGPEKLQSTVKAIKDLYGRDGYIEASVHYEARLDEKEPIYNVHYTIDEGEKYKIGLIHILGNIHTQDRVILRESLLIPGENFDIAKLQATEMRLQNIGYFKGVNVYAVRTRDDDALGPNYRDVYIEVKETTTGNISLFFGASSADSVFGGLDLAETNFNFKGLGCLFTEGLSALRGGGEYAHIKITIGKKQTTYSFSWMDPYFNDSLWRVGFDVNKANSTLISKDYNIDSFGFTIYTSYPLTSFLSWGLKYRWRDTHMHISDHAGEDAKRLSGKSGIISAASTSLGYDSTDSPIKPHQGYRGALEAEYAGLGGRFEFIRLSSTNSLYTPLWQHGFMKYRADFAFIEPSGKTGHPFQIPISERFFQGGDTSVRGYEAYAIGPRYKRGDPTGGISTSVLSLEYLHEVFSFLDVFAFADAGTVSMRRFRISKSHYRTSVGLGARVQLMSKIPFIVGYGWPINPGKTEKRQFFFSMGGQF